jgi:hypothetical protein
MMRVLAVALPLLSALWIVPADAQSARIGAGRGGERGVNIPNYTANNGLPHWRSCRARVLAGTGNCTVLFIGESTTAGFDALYNTVGSNALSAAMPSQVAGILTTVYGISSQTNDVMGNKNVDSDAGVSANYQAFDTRTTLGNWIILGPGTDKAPGPLGGYFFAGGNTAMEFAPSDLASYPGSGSILTDTIDVYVLNTGSANLTVKVGDTTLCTRGSISSLTRVTCSAPRADNTYAINCDVQFQCAIMGWVARDSTTSQVIMINGAWGGATSAQWASNHPNIAALAPDLCVINEIGNDSRNQTPAATYRSNLTAVVNSCKQTGDVLLTTGTMGKGPPRKNSLITAVKSIGAATGSPVWDSASLGSSTGWTAQTNARRGWNGSINGAAPDTAHQGAAGYAVYASFIAQILAQ